MIKKNELHFTADYNVEKCKFNKLIFPQKAKPKSKNMKRAMTDDRRMTGKTTERDTTTKSRSKERKTIAHNMNLVCEKGLPENNVDDKLSAAHNREKEKRKGKTK